MSEPIEQSALEKLNDAIAEYVRELHDDEPMLGAWVVAYQTQWLVDEPGMLPVVTDFNYAMAPSASGEALIGLLTLASARAMRDALEAEE